ncbi:heme-binding protein [Parerythrobacter aestuarii]|uniref:heme-binding protein n=1 Tax=Parerythrobacter aestuarii TaxID=3020909 RepID=UPI0024DE0AC8|nr:heme-binding protein [Parerythrobacter aestuarii]
MPIDTNFRFSHDHNQPLGAEALKSLTEDGTDFLQLLRGLVGSEPADQPRRVWQGTGFNMIWRPNFGGQSGNTAHFLQLNMTGETLSFTDISGDTGIANRSLFEKDIFLGGAAYLQEIVDTFDNSGQHFEPGVFNLVPATTDPNEPVTVVRMGSIPHGTTINMQGIAFEVVEPRIDPVSITPFVIGDPTSLVPFPEEDLSNALDSRTDLARVPGLDQAHLDDPNQFLRDALDGQTIDRTVVIQLTTRAADPIPPEVGGGVANIAFLEGTENGPNADVPLAQSTFWIETGTDRDGSPLLQLQYTQMVLLDFNGLSWPHVTVATLRPQG